MGTWLLKYTSSSKPSYLLNVSYQIEDPIIRNQETSPRNQFVASSLEMGASISRDDDSTGKDPSKNANYPRDDNPQNDHPNDDLPNDSQDDDPQNGPQNDDPQNDPQNFAQNGFEIIPLNVSQNNSPATVLTLPQVQGFWGFESLFSTVYPFQHRVMSHLNRLEFSKLQLAGIRTPISQELQRCHLIPSQCNEVHLIPGLDPETCSHTTRTVDEIKVCHGWHHDGWGPRGRQQQWVEPKILYKHLHESNSFVRASDQTECGQFDSFNVCIHCHDRDRQRRDGRENFIIRYFRSNFCMAHNLEFAKQRPYNVCRCKMFLDKYWRCNRCAERSLQELRLRAQTFGEVACPTFVFDVVLQMYLDSRTDTPRRRSACPVLGCTGVQWVSAPIEKQMVMCRACTAIFPRAWPECVDPALNTSFAESRERIRHGFHHLLPSRTPLQTMRCRNKGNQ